MGRLLRPRRDRSGRAEPSRPSAAPLPGRAGVRPPAAGRTRGDRPERQRRAAGWRPARRRCHRAAPAPPRPWCPPARTRRAAGPSPRLPGEPGIVAPQGVLAPAVVGETEGLAQERQDVGGGLPFQDPLHQPRVPRVALRLALEDPATGLRAEDPPPSAMLGDDRAVAGGRSATEDQLAELAEADD